MTTLAILRNSLRLNAKSINQLQFEADTVRNEVRAWAKSGERAFATAAAIDLRKFKAKLAKAVAMQKRIKVEIAAYFRSERIIRKYEQVFGKLPIQQAISFEQEAMLDALILERNAVAKSQQSTQAQKA